MVQTLPRASRAAGHGRDHELRHSAADEIWRTTGNIVLAQQLLRHESVATTQAYLHPSRDDLLEGLRHVDQAWQVVRSEDPDVA